VTREKRVVRKERPSTAVENNDASASGLPFQQRRQDRRLSDKRGLSVQTLPEKPAQLLQKFNTLNAPQGVQIHKTQPCRPRKA
jgi:hypothetical protein